MKCKLINEDNQRTWMVVFHTGEEAAEGLLHFARKKELAASQITAIGAFSEVDLGYFDIEKKDYEKIQIREQTEVLSLIGDITLGEHGPKVHAHAVLGKRNGTACGGHLLRGIVRPTLEVVITESPVHLRRKHDPRSGLALIDPELA
jgi:predicted DNA-binding protein with PD1-like motif